MNRLARRCAGAGVVVCALMSLQCPDPVDTTGRDLLTLERVWQYCSVYSLYQENLPSREAALAMTYPDQVVAALKDTLHTHAAHSATRYGEYFDYCPLGGASAGLAGVRASSRQTLFYTRLSENTGYLRIAVFEDSTDHELRRIAVAAVGAVSNLIVDLMGNPGGNLDAATRCMDILLPAGTPYLARRYRRNILADGGERGTVFDTLVAQSRSDSLAAWKNKRVAVLIDGGSASASEIMAVALRDGLGSQARLLGATSYGKAIGQYIFCFFSAPGGIELTGFRFYRLSGVDYHEAGIQPDEPLAGTTVRAWITDAGSALETGFTANLYPGALDALLDLRAILASSMWGSAQLSAATQPCARPVCYRRLEPVPFPLF